MEKVAEKAGRAAPAVAIAGALVAAPQLQHALAGSAKPARIAAAGTHKPTAAHGQRSVTATLESTSTRNIPASGAGDTRHAAAKTAPRNTYYKVRTGDTLSKIAGHYYHNAGDWQWLYHENEKTVSDPNMIYPGQTLFVPGTVPAHYTVSDYVPRHAKPVAPVVTSASSGGGGTAVVQSVGQGSSGSSASGRGSTTLSGTLSCSGLEQLWKAAGGNPADAFMAAEIAMAESGGNQYAHSPTDDFGYWQINVSNGALATYDAYGNARSAVIISHDGTDWYPWTTYTSGAYAGRC